MLDPQLLLDCSSAPAFATGTCGPACEADADCAAYDGDTGRYGCVEGTCRPRGCMSDAECRNEPGGALLGYCELHDDFTQNTCVYESCRTGVDPRTGCGSSEPYGIW